MFDYLKKIFNLNGYRLYMIGSTSRDYLLNRKITDYDFVTDAKCNESMIFLINLDNAKIDDTFACFGTLKLYLEGKTKIDIVTLRKESDYLDNRHPSKIEFIKDIYIDYKRRDFTINAIYIDENYKVFDPSTKGIDDLKNRRLNFIKDPIISIKEDPLRILRAYRFKEEYNLIIDKDTLKILNENEYLLENINKDKIKEEERKLEKIRKEAHYVK